MNIYKSNQLILIKIQINFESIFLPKIEIDNYLSSFILRVQKYQNCLIFFII
jgi:hypothetical protein